MKHLVLLLVIATVAACAPTAAVDSTPESVSTQPIPVSAPPPHYPREALMSGTPGWVRLGLHINDDGTVSDVRVIESEPGRLFAASARRAVERWRFDPADAGSATYTIKFEVGSAAHDH